MKLKISSLFLIGVFVYMVSSVFLESSFSSMGVSLRILKYIGIVICIVPMINKKKIEKNLILIIGILTATCVINTFIFGGGSTIFECIIIVFAFYKSKNDCQSVFYTSLLAIVVSHAIVIALALMGVIEDYVSSRWFGNYMGSFFEGEYVRHQMGFLSSNQVPLALMIIYLMLIAVMKDRISLWIHVVFSILNFYTFVFFGARVSFIIIFLAMIFYYLIKMGNLFRKKTIIEKILQFSFVGCAIISYICSFMYNSSSGFWNLANMIFYNRLRWSKAALEKYGFSLFGYGLEAGKATGQFGEFLVDNGYVLTLIQRGIIITLLILFIWTYALRKAKEEHNSYMILVLTMIAVASLVDNHLTSFKMLPFFCYMLDYQNNSRDASLRGCK